MSITAKLRRLILERHHNICNRCGFTDVRALQVDHVYGGGSKEVKELGSSTMYLKALEDTKGNYQVLCANCNLIKYIEEKEKRKQLEKFVPLSHNHEEIFSKLDTNFTTSELKELLGKTNNPTVNRMLKKWYKAGLILKYAHGQWIKR